ncbi:MAG: enoyl-CoA hydratase/isomerase family protein [Alphaproteobacteria bacterium]|jgi:enoyl-CoA hydratase|nr:enoyl-CoA hydratase/isomerase family protein [Alphaproteobacteria bacterium]MDP6815972.1 enoyl-CoA hydratase/isomerase family protein [Alphaproteobacteria bacterium]
MSELTVDRRGDIAVLTINLPDNYMTAATVAELNAATAELDADEGCRAMVFTGGREGVFIRHYSVKVLEEMADQLRAKEQSFSEAKPLLHDRDIDHLFRRLATTPKITIAAINGFAMGGGFEFCLSCDLRLAQDGDFALGLPEIKVGILPGAGGTQKLARVVGRARALEMVLRGRTVPPREALELGMVHEVTEGPVLPRALELAGEYAAMSPIAFGHIKRLMRQELEKPLEDGLVMERTLFLDCLVSDQAKELMQRMNQGDLDIREVPQGEG